MHVHYSEPQQFGTNFYLSTSSLCRNSPSSSFFESHTQSDYYSGETSLENVSLSCEVSILSQTNTSKQPTMSSPPDDWGSSSERCSIKNLLCSSPLVQESTSQVIQNSFPPQSPVRPREQAPIHKLTIDYYECYLKIQVIFSLISLLCLSL